MEPIEGSETSDFKPQKPGKYPKENILHVECFFVDPHSELNDWCKKFEINLLVTSYRNTFTSKSAFQH